MSTSPINDASWDFSHISAALHALSYRERKGGADGGVAEENSELSRLEQHLKLEAGGSGDDQTHLGNFDKIWEFLNVPRPDISQDGANATPNNGAGHKVASIAVLETTAGLTTKQSLFRMNLTPATSPAYTATRDAKATFGNVSGINQPRSFLASSTVEVTTLDAHQYEQSLPSKSKLKPTTNENKAFPSSSLPLGSVATTSVVGRKSGESGLPNRRLSSSDSSVDLDDIGSQYPLDPFQDNTAYTSDGAIYRPPITKGVRFQGIAEESGEEEPSLEEHGSTKQLSKKQRKKLNRRLRKQAEEDARLAQIDNIKGTSDFESEAPKKAGRTTPARKASVHTLTPEANSPLQHRNPLRSLGPLISPATTPTTRTTKEAKKLKEAFVPSPAQPAKRSSSSLSSSESVPPTANKSAIGPATPPSPLPANRSPKKASPSLLAPTGSSTKAGKKANKTQANTKAVKADLPHVKVPKTPPSKGGSGSSMPAIYQPYYPSTSNFNIQPYLNGVQQVQHMQPYARSGAMFSTPMQARPLVSHTPNARLTVATQPAVPEHPLTPLPKAGRAQQGSMMVRRGEDRNWHFLLKLIQDFGEDKKWLTSPAQKLKTVDGIHVFVDASNILIGFQERIRVLGLGRQFPNVSLSFDALVLLMERRRPVGKRVLVGSKPLLPAFETARAVGYETCLLDKVYKARELTERQIFFRTIQHQPILSGNETITDGDQRPAMGGGGGGAAKGGKGSERTSTTAVAASKAPLPPGLPGTTETVSSTGASAASATATTAAAETAAAAAAAAFAPEAWVEQGVDEILHMKILESLVDCSSAPSTIVLASGDAAAAEFSEGFMKQVVRALEKGWKVELVSWAKGISAAYRRRDFAMRWGDQFRIVYLDAYVSDLMDV